METENRLFTISGDPEAHDHAVPPASPGRGTSRLADIGARAGLDLAYLVIGLVTSALAFTVVVVGLSVTLSLVLFIVGVPLIALCALAFRWTAELDRRNAALVLGAPLRGRYRDHEGEPFVTRLFSPLRDPQTWRDLLWLVLHSFIGFAFGVAALTAVGLVAGAVTMPAWYWAIPDGPDVGVWSIDTLPKALAVSGVAIVLAAVTVGLLRLMARGESWVAGALLGSVREAPGRAAGAGPGWRLRTATDPHAALLMQGALSVLVGGACTVIWALTGGGYFWPAWVLGAWGAGLALHAWETFAHRPLTEHDIDAELERQRARAPRS
jgi:hypothetical protein